MIEHLAGFLPEIVVGGVGALGHAGISKFIKYRKDKSLKLKYPVFGDYISKFEDEIDGLKIEFAAPVCLTQSGIEIKGKTSFDGRIWLLEGRVSSDRYIYGRYFAENRYDGGEGNFFLKINAVGDMEGLWSGYDSVNKRILSGSYKFKRASVVTINSINKKIISKILHIAEKELGDSYIDEKKLMSGEGSSFYATCENEVAGFCLGQALEINEFLSRFPQVAQQNVKALHVTDNVGLISSIAVLDKYKGRGVGTQLIKKCIQAIGDQNVRVFVMIGWKSLKGVHIAGVAQYVGFEKLFEMPNYWYEDSKKFGYRCPQCGAPPCECTAVFFIKHC